MSQTAPVDVSRLLDTERLGGYQRWLVGLTALAIVFDGIDIQLMGVAIPSIMREWAVPRSAFAPAVSFGYLGMVAGGATAGLLGDRVGRRTALLACMLLFGAMTAAASLSQSVPMFALLRFAAGIGLGGAIPNAAALAAEFVPLRLRPLAVTVTVVCTPVGATVAGLVSIQALPAFGWRALFLIGGVLPILAAVALRWLLPESPRFLAGHPERRQELILTLRRMGQSVRDEATLPQRAVAPVDGASIRMLLARDFRRDTVALWTAFLSCMLTVYLAFNWLPSLLAGAGFSSSLASAGITAFNLGGVVGALIGGVSITRWGSRTAMLVMAAMAVVSAGAMSTMTFAPGVPPFPILAMLTVTGALINAVQTTMFALAAHVYPAGIRATGVGTAASFGRFGAVISGYVGVWALEFRGAASFFGVIALALVVCSLALAIVTSHIPRRA
jgi:MFS transporter, AAHS family, 4-hydroxybenzoate transporter